MKILIVDDIEDNRYILERLILQFSRKHNIETEVLQAENGQVAVDTCNDTPVDLIFMDIVMPVMDGLEATKIIKEAHPSALIIVVSSENDEAVKVKILQAGAEDYVLKPFSSAIMMSRLINYHKLVLSRNAIGFQTRAVNVFTHNVYSYQLKFFISSDDELAQFWETMLVRLDFQNHIQSLSDFVRFLFRLGTLQIQKSYKCHIYVEEDEDHFYITMDNMRLLSADTIHQLIEKHAPDSVYELEDNLLTFVLATITKDTSLIAPEQVKEKTAVTHAPVASPAAVVVKETLQTYDILDEEAVEEFEYVISKLQTEVMMMGSSALEMDDIDTMNEYIKKLATILSISKDAYEISASLNDFSALLDEYSEPFLAMSKDLASMMKSFINDLLMWKEMIFHTGAPSVDFLNSSISSNVQMIRAVFVTDETEVEDMDDIFDF